MPWQYKPKPKRRLPIKPEWFAAVRKGMEGVVDHGTAAGIKSSIVQIAGQTGTAEAVPTVDNPNGRNHTWFVSYAPASHPQIVCVVLCGEGGRLRRQRGGTHRQGLYRILVDACP